MAVKHFVDEIPPSTGRAYQITTDGNISRITDITDYQQVGTGFGAKDVNSVCVLECNYAKSGIVHQLTTENVESENIKFFATESFKKGDKFVFNGVEVIAQTIDGKALSNLFFVKNTVVECRKRENILYFVGGSVPDYSITPEKLSKNYVEYYTPILRGYGDLDLIIANGSEQALYRVDVSGLSHFYSILGDGYYTALIDSERQELTLTNHSTGKMWLYKEGSEEFISLSTVAEEHIAEVSEKGGMVTLTDPQLDALDNLFDLTAYTSDKSKDAYEAFVKAFGLDNYRVQREFTIDELFPCGLSYLREANITGAVMSEYGYYTKQGTNRYGYIYFDIPCKYGYTYKFNFETTQSTDNVAIELYNEYALNQVEAEGDYRSADHKEYNWIGNGGEITPPELINGYAPAGLRFVFNTGTPGVTKIKISKKRVL